ncbi:MAG: hypothetical protein FJ304_01905 [Planctomycetes bacterium]|nr:hypothetical protein [Planctomycetota bacterium]
MDFFIDPPRWWYLLLGGFLVISGAVASQKQSKRATLAFGVAFFLMLLAFLVDKSSESPREEAVRRTFMIGASADAKNPDAFVEHVADTVTVHTADAPAGKPLSRDELKKHPFWDLLRKNNVKVSVADFAREDVVEIDANTIEIGFLGKGTPQGLPTIPVYMKGTFKKQPGGSYKLSALKLYDHLDRKKLATVPNFP